MDDLQRRINQHYNDSRSRKVRFKISSAYSGRVLKQVFEDGEQLEPPEEEHPRGIFHRNFESGEYLYGLGEATDPQFYAPTNLIARKISVIRDGSKYGIGGGHYPSSSLTPADPSNVIDFGKIIIYTSNLKIIRTPLDKRELLIKFDRDKNEQQIFSQADGGEGCQSNTYLESLQNPVPTESADSEHGCLHCGGSGCLPCSLCHGSKFSMHANRFKESFQEIRCPACNRDGLQPCQMCAK
ncbi:glutaredoxin domain-containing cysteine-rich protein 2 [Protopterus annectens]|uniref:glutaredoxin domain-containing cysteine-rich protein 2 n=1 Tax=Protopterus annectens TaxID=7888 RepID=UPI001CFB1D0C|nr:glutaredoxin domain-containing cysteine-rich protein 2 [Protopterus annectens]